MPLHIHLKELTETVLKLDVGVRQNNDTVIVQFIPSLAESGFLSKAMTNNLLRDTAAFAPPQVHINVRKPLFVEEYNFVNVAIIQVVPENLL